jgi:DNA-binding SARP family transcriptional activator
MHFRLLGAVQITVDGEVGGDAGGEVVGLGGWQRRALLAMLLLHANHTVAVDRLIAMLWPSGRPRSASRNLQVRISQLRRLLAEAEGDDRRGAERLVFREPGYLLRVSDGELDLHRFERLVDHGRQELAAGRAGPAAETLRQGLRLWHGGALEDVQAGAAVLAGHRARLEKRRLAAVEDRIEADLMLGRHADLAGELTSLVAEHPLRERLRAQLMLALHRSGRAAEALAEYRDARAMLRREAGLEPGPDLRRVERTILTSATPPAGAGPAHLRDRVPRTRPCQLPADIAAFTGRAAALARLDALLPDPARPATAGPLIAVVSGTPGVGKTALAIHWAHRAAVHFPDGQLYVNLRGFDSAGPVVRPEEAVCGFLDALDVPVERIPVRRQAQIGLYRSLLRGLRMLVMLDNARDVEQVRPLLPGSPGCLVVVTSRCELPGLTATAGAHPVTLDLLARDEAAHMLAHRLGAGRLAAEPAVTERILDRCAGLPLAVAIVAARASARPGQSLDTLTGELRADRDRLDAFATGDAATDLRTVFSWSYRAVSEPAARLFRLLGTHPGTDLGVPVAASLAGVRRDRARVLLAELTRAHLVTEPAAGRFTLHDLLRAYAVELADTRETGPDRTAALRRLLDHYCLAAHAATRLIHRRDPIRLPDPAPGVTVVGFDDPGRAMSWFSDGSSVLPALVGSAARAGFDTQAWILAWAFTPYFERQGRWQDWLAVQQAGLAAVQRLGDRPAQARALRGLATAYGRTGDDDRALRHLRHALRLNVELGDRDGQGHTRLALAWITGRRGWTHSALMHAERALSLFRQTHHTVGEANALNSIGFTRVHLGQPRLAVASCRQALALLRRLGDRAGEASAWDSIGFAYHHLGRTREAIASFRRALRIYDEIGDHHGEAETLIRLGDALQENHDGEAARRSWRRAAQLRIELGGEDGEPTPG